MSDDPRDDRASDRRGHELGPAELEAAWRDIVAHYGDRPEDAVDAPAEEGAGADDAGDTERDDPDDSDDRTDADRPAGSVLDRSYLDALDSHEQRGPAPAERRWRDDEEHYVPPPPPPVPRPTPLRRAAWIALCLPPVLMLAAMVLGWTFPAWFSLLLVGGFIGGFLSLVATMPREHGDGWDDGAVV